MSSAWAVPSADLVALSRELVLAGGAVFILLLDAFVPRLRRLSLPLALLVVLTAGLMPWSVPESSGFGGLLVQNDITMAFGTIVLVTTLLSILASNGFLRRHGLPPGEYAALLLWCAAGMLLMMRATELLTIFVALELFSICLYTLAGYHRRSSMATEAAIKYFLLGAFVSAFVLYGIALLYGETGSTRLDVIAQSLADAGGLSPMALLGLLLLVAGFGFKMSLVPFHAAGGGESWRTLMAVLAAVSMVVGNVLALVQRDIKRMLAYSGISHMGYVLIPLAAWTEEGWEAIGVYLLAYALMNAGAFVIVSALYAKPGEPHLISDLSGWGFRFPGMALALTVCMVSLSGIPPMLGFLGKYLVFVHAVREGVLWLAILGVATSLLGAFYYLRVVYTLYMKTEECEPTVPFDLGSRLAAWLAAGSLLVLGLFLPRLLGMLDGVLFRVGG